MHFAKRAIMPSVADDAVLIGMQSCEHRGLRSACDGWKRRFKRAHAAGGSRKFFESRRMRADEVRRESDDVDERDSLHRLCQR